MIDLGGLILRIGRTRSLFTRCRKGMIWSLGGAVLSCCRRSDEQDCEGPRSEKSLKSALKRPKIIALTGLTLALEGGLYPAFSET
jgi:hypothetical protein